jgi:hypothetical protein
MVHKQSGRIALCDERARVSLFAHEIRWPIEHHLRRSGARALRRLAPAISMMKAAESGAGDYCRSQRRLALHGPSIRRVLIEGIVNPVVVVVVHVIANEPPQVLFVQRDDMVENLAAAASVDLGNSICTFSAWDMPSSWSRLRREQEC